MQFRLQVLQQDVKSFTTVRSGMEAVVSVYPVLATAMVK